MARAVASSRRQGETDEDRATRLAAEEVHRRLEQAREREVEEAYWRSRSGGGTTSSSAARRGPAADLKNAHGRATPRATLSGVQNTPDHFTLFRDDGDAGGLASDAEVDALARAVSRVGATPDVSLRVATQVLAAERAAVEAVMRRVSTRVRSGARPPRGSGRDLVTSSRGLAAGGKAHDDSIDPDRRRVVALAFETPMADSSFDGWRGNNTRSPGGARFEDDFVTHNNEKEDVDDEENDTTAHVSSALWGAAHTPVRSARKTQTRRAKTENAFSEDEDDDSTARSIQRIAKSPAVMDPTTAASFARGPFASDSRAFKVALSQAAAAAVEDGLRQLVAKVNSDARLKSPAKSPVLGSGGSFVGKENENEEYWGTSARALRRRSSNGSHASSHASSDNSIEEAWVSEESLFCAGGGDDETGRGEATGGAVLAAWSEHDALAVREAHLAVRRAEQAVLCVCKEEQTQRVNTTHAVAKLLDAKVSLAVATARAVSEEAAVSAAAVSSGAAGLRLTLDDCVGDGGRGVGTCEALAGALTVPLPRLPKLEERARGSDLARRNHAGTFENTVRRAMSGITMGMADAMAFVDSITKDDTLTKDENTPPVVETGKLARAKGGLSTEARAQLNAAKITFDEYLGGTQVGLRREQVEVWCMEDLVCVEKLGELKLRRHEAQDAGTGEFFPDKNFFPVDAYELLIKHHLTAGAYVLFDKHFTRWPGCHTRRVGLDEALKATFHLEHVKKKIVFTEVVVTLEARNARRKHKRPGRVSVTLMSTIDEW